jgi:hypothetical protein
MWRAQVHRSDVPVDCGLALLHVLPGRAQRAAAGGRVPSTRAEDSAPCVIRVPPGAPAAPTHPISPPEQLGGSPWTQQLASGRRKAEGVATCQPAGAVEDGSGRGPLRRANLGGALPPRVERRAHARPRPRPPAQPADPPAPSSLRRGPAGHPVHDARGGGHEGDLALPQGARAFPALCTTRALSSRRLAPPLSPRHPHRAPAHHRLVSV